MFLPYIPLSFLIVHTVGDFTLQNNFMAVNKSKRLDALLLHVLIYSFTFLLFTGFAGYNFEKLPLFFALTFISHFVTDFVTSRISQRLFPFIKTWPSIPEDREYTDLEGRGWRSRHRFFECIGYDQLIHFATLSFTYQWLIR